MNKNRRVGWKRIIVPDNTSAPVLETGGLRIARYRDAVVIVIDRVFLWKRLLDEGKSIARFLRRTLRSVWIPHPHTQPG